MSVLCEAPVIIMLVILFTLYGIAGVSICIFIGMSRLFPGQLPLPPVQPRSP